MKLQTKAEFRTRRHHRVRRKISGTAERPRMCVYVSNQHMYVQFVDDTTSTTLAAASTREKGFAPAGKNNAEAARELGRRAAKAALDKGISTVVFDRGGFSYEGRIKMLADAAREAGLRF